VRRTVIVDGPESGGIDERTGDEYPVWTVATGDEDGEPDGRAVYTCRSLATARRVAQNMARDRNLELVDDAQPA